MLEKPVRTIWPCNYPGCVVALPDREWLVEHLTSHIQGERRPKVGKLGHLLAYEKALAEVLKIQPLTVTVQPVLKKIRQPAETNSVTGASVGFNMA